jgi:hypothetical protein
MPFFEQQAGVQRVHHKTSWDKEKYTGMTEQEEDEGNNAVEVDCKQYV